MTQQNTKNRKFWLGDDFDTATVTINGYELSTDNQGNATLTGAGDVTIITQGDVFTYTDGDVLLREPEPEQINAIQALATKRAYHTGDVLPDGWVVGPVSPETGEPVSYEPVSGALDGYRTWYQGENHAADLRAQGHAGARQPTARELSATYNQVVKADRNHHAQFNTSGSYPFGTYWTSTPFELGPDNARMQYLGADNIRFWNFKDKPLGRVRCLRDEPGIKLA